MKKLTTIILLFAVIGLIASCGKKTTPEDEVRNYGNYFVEKLNANQLDSLKITYPGIAEADSIVAIKSDTIVVTETAPGLYDLTIAEGVILKVNRSEDGNITVTESRGLFAFPDNKLVIAKKTGMWNDTISDAQLNERMKDEEFFKYIDKNVNAKKNKILTINGGTVTNNTDKTIDGSEFTVTKAFHVRGNYFSRGATSYSSIKGKTLKPGESMRVSLVQALMGMEYLSGIKWVIPQEEVITKYIPFSGNEYQEYLDSKKQ